MSHLKPFFPAICYAFIAGFMGAFNYAPYNLWWLNIFALALLFWQLSKRSWFVGLVAVYFFWVSYFISGMNWVHAGMAIYSRVSAEKAVLITVFIGLIYALFLTLPWLIYGRTIINSLSRFFLFPLIWLLGEWGRYYLFDGLIWLIQGYGHQSSWLSGWIPVFGALGASFFSVVTATLIVACLQHPKSQILISCLAGLGLIWAGGLALQGTNWTESTGTSIPVVSIQANQYREFGSNTDFEARNQQWVQELENASRDKWQPGILVWPEGAIKKDVGSIDAYLQQMAELATHNETAFFSGGPFYSDEDILPHSSTEIRFAGGAPSYNSLYALGKAEGKYHKVRRAPLGEYSPLDGRLGKLIPWLSSVEPPRLYSHQQQQPLKFSYSDKKFLISPSICYELAFANLIRQTAAQSNMLLNISNDAWFNGTHELDQALQVAQIRALEHQKPMIRSTNTGLTALIDHKGNILEIADREVATVLEGNIEPRTGQTPYAKWGDAPILLIAFLWALSIPMFTYTRKSKRLLL